MSEQNAVSALQVRGVAVRHDGQVTIEGIDLTMSPGEILAVLGPSGCGKSTLLRGVAGLEPLAAGSVSYGGMDLARVPVHRRGFALMFQDGQLFGHLSVARNVEYALKLRRVPAARRRARVAELLDLVGLSGYDRRSPSTLSGGERQRVALARALATEPRLLLLDEPLSALDATLREHLAGELAQILRAAGTTTILVTHDHEEAFAIADSMAVMRSGRVVQQGPIEQVWAHPVDADTARFLGYAAVLAGAAARVTAAGAGLDAGHDPVLALRRSALVAAPEGPLRAVVRSARLTPEQLRLQVELIGVSGPSGEALVLDAVAGADSHPAPGEEISLRVVAGHTAVLGVSSVAATP